MRTSRRNFNSRTVAYLRFLQTLQRTSIVIDAGLKGLEGKQKVWENLLVKLSSIKGSPGPRPAKFKAAFKVEKTADGNIQVQSDARSFIGVRKETEVVLREHKIARFHLYSILAVSVWGALETYLTMLFAELFGRRPEMLKCEDPIRVRDVVDHRSGLIDFLIERELDKIGHFTLDETFKYLDNKLNISFTPQSKMRLEEFYLIRNIIAHNTGIVRGNLRTKLPKTVMVKNHEITITKQFLGDMLRNIEMTARQIESKVIAKFFKART